MEQRGWIFAKRLRHPQNKYAPNYPPWSIWKMCSSPNQPWKGNLALIYSRDQDQEARQGQFHPSNHHLASSHNYISTNKTVNKTNFFNSYNTNNIIHLPYDDRSLNWTMTISRCQVHFVLYQQARAVSVFCVVANVVGAGLLIRLTTGAQLAELVAAREVPAGAWLGRVVHAKVLILHNGCPIYEGAPVKFNYLK